MTERLQPMAIVKKKEKEKPEILFCTNLFFIIRNPFHKGIHS